MQCRKAVHCFDRIRFDQDPTIRTERDEENFIVQFKITSRLKMNDAERVEHYTDQLTSP